jgi:hypothetical protein
MLIMEVNRVRFTLKGFIKADIFNAFPQAIHKILERG